MDVVIRIPSCYPLRAVDVECTRRLGINKTLLRKWILSMAAFLRNQVSHFALCRRKVSVFLLLLFGGLGRRWDLFVVSTENTMK